MAWIFEVLVGLLACGFAILHDRLTGAATTEVGLKQSLVIAAAIATLADGLWRSGRSRRGLLAALSEPGRRGTFATALLAGLLFALCLFAFRHYAVDDSWIAFRYARVTLATGSVTWNPAGPPVEGYSNFLWMLLAMGALALRLDPFAVSRAVSVACLLASAWMVHRLARGECRTAYGPRLAVLALAATPALAFWALSGLETASVVALVLAWLLALRSDFASGRLPWRSALPGLALVLSRPEGPLLVGLGLLPALASASPGERGRALRVLALVVLLSVPYFAWKQVHFGTMVPNTFSAKWRHLEGLSLALQGYAFVFPLLPLAAVGFARGAGRFERQAWLLWAGLLLASANVKPQVGHYQRFLLPAWGAMAALAGTYAERLGDWLAPAAPARRARAVGTALGLAALAWLLAPIFDMHTYADGEARGFETAHVPIGRALAATFRPDEVLATSDCGLVPYLSGMQTIDLWGLTDRSIATRGLDPREVLRRHPAVVMLNSLQPERFDPRESYDRLVHEAIASDPELVLRGRWPFYGYWVWVWARRPLVTAARGS